VNVLLIADICVSYFIQSKRVLYFVLVWDWASENCIAVMPKTLWTSNRSGACELYLMFSSDF
jgi:hypothetical protein